MKTNKLFATFLTIAFAFVIGIFSTQEVSAQRYLSEIKDSSEVNGLVQFADNLANFLELAEKIEGGQKDDAIYMKIEFVGKKIKDGTSNTRSNLKGLVNNFKNKNQWNDELDNQFNQFLGSRKIKAFYQRNGGRKILTDADAAIGSIGTEIDAIMTNLKALKSSSASNIQAFSQTSFSPTASARKVRVKCVALGVGIFIAELKGAKKTAENLDGFFDKSCGAGANTAT